MPTTTLASPPITDTWGAVHVSVFLGALYVQSPSLLSQLASWTLSSLYGIATLQTWLYFFWYPKDNWKLKSIVSFILMIDAIAFKHRHIGPSPCVICIHSLRFITLKYFQGCRNVSDHHGFLGVLHDTHRPLWWLCRTRINSLVSTPNHRRLALFTGTGKAQCV